MTPIRTADCKTAEACTDSRPAGLGEPAEPIQTKMNMVSTAKDNSAERIAVVAAEDGLHMRPAMKFVECANSFSSQIQVIKDHQTVDGKSIMQMTMLAATRGTELRIRARGQDASQAVEALAALIETQEANG